MCVFYPVFNIVLRGLFFWDCVAQVTGIGGIFWAGWIELADDDCDTSSGFEGGSISLKISFCDKNIVCEFRDLGDGSSIVAIK